MRYVMALLFLVAVASGSPLRSEAGTSDGAIAVDCDASSVGVQNTCEHAEGSSFTIEVHVTAPPSSGYFGFQANLGWQSAIAYSPAADPAAEGLWPQCDLPARSEESQRVIFACIPLPLPTQGDSFTGAVLAFTFSCISAGVALIDLADAAEEAAFPTTFYDDQGREMAPTLFDASTTCIADTDRDGVPDASDNCVATANSDQADFDLDGMGDECDLDDDNDGCRDGQEEGSNATIGGLRDPRNFWDFFDTPDQTNIRDRVIGAGDIARVIGRFGTSGDQTIDPHSSPPSGNYHTAFDRTPGVPWTGPPNGAVSAQDVFLVVQQFGHTCA